MKFRVLGSLEVEDDRGLVAIGTGMRRAALAVLLLHAKEVIPADRLIDELWAEAPPASARKALQDAHLAFRADLRDQGYLVAGGPLLGQDGERLRGISVMSVDPATARELCSADPAVRAGRLAVQVMTWMVPAGNIRFEDVPAPRSMAEAAAD